ncbi:hypothetical protein IB024_15070 [Brucella sp. 6810]|uniref:hypothetical protein n=1 Tax=Brucella sp. 6810 TaxID=2769351 RepID=UPI00165CCF4A|nr:hypothetical protein [Brucella sp. 6810]QNQ63568.1 hypothetical protein IB024_15070 [Brucella sp. 6810]
MTNDNRDILLQRLRYLTEEFSFLEDDISAKLQRLKKIGEELSTVNKALQELQAAPKHADSKMVNRVQIPPQSTGSYTRNGVKIRRGSIKDYVVQVLSDSQKGMVALDILAAINERFEKNYDRTSLSPQLSRLRQDGVLGLRGPVWYLARNNSDLV